MLPKMRLETYERSMPCYDNSEIFYWINYHNDIIYGTLLDVAVVFECCCYGARVPIHGTAGHTMFVIIQSICLPQWLSTWAMPQCGVLSTSAACHNCFRSTCMCVSYLAVPVRCDGGECVVRAPAHCLHILYNSYRMHVDFVFHCSTERLPKRFVRDGVYHLFTLSRPFECNTALYHRVPRNE